jgi:hypothetical protein
MLFRLAREGQNSEFHPYLKRSASDLGLLEKDLENWVAAHPELLFGVERVLVIGQSVSGQRMGDILALDADGRLVVVEMKRDWSDRATVGQLLEYAARMAESSYDAIEILARAYWKDPQASLLERFRDLTDDQTVERPNLPKGQRICVVAPGSDEELRRIVRWLKQCGVPIEFVPFTLYASSNAADLLLEIEPLPKSRPDEAPAAVEWRGDWFFNTNETYAPGAYEKMFSQEAIAIQGYETGPENLTGTAEGQRVFAYVNRKGILAVGRVVDGNVIPGSTIFDDENEFHLKVKWDVIVAHDKGVTNREVAQAYDYNLPVRCVFCGLYRHDVADWIAAELRQRSATEGGRPSHDAEKLHNSSASST